MRVAFPSKQDVLMHSFHTQHLFPLPSIGTLSTQYTKWSKADGRIGLAKDEINPGHCRRPRNMLETLPSTS